MPDTHPPRRPVSIRGKQHGDDIAALQREVNQRLDAYPHIGASFKCARDGVYGPKTARACSRALYLLGVDTATVNRSKVENGGKLSPRAQNLIRHPRSRGKSELATQRQRVERERQQYEKRQKAKKATAAIETHSLSAVAAATRAARLALAHAPEIHYTQGPHRWDGINLRKIAAHGEYPSYADCSAFYTWCLWQLLGEGVDVLNGANWAAGYTGTLLTHGTKVSEAREGDAVIYGTGWPGEHVAYALGGGMVISHGSEGGPYLLPIGYRGDLLEIRRYV